MTDVYADVNARAAAIGEKLTATIIANNDVVTARKLRQCAVELYDAIIPMVAKKPDYQIWHAALLKANHDSPFNQIDTTGEFTKIVAELDAIDATTYFIEHVLPLANEQGLAQLVRERDELLNIYDNVIALLLNNGTEDVLNR